MSNTQQDHADWTAPLRELIASLRALEARFSNASETIRRIRPDEKIGNFPSLESIERLGLGDLGIRECFAKLAVQAVERRAEELRAEAEEKEQARAENLRRQNMSPADARIERLERALSSLAARVTRLEGERPGRLPALPHVTRAADVPQLLGQPGGMGRPAAVHPAGNGGARRVRAADAEVSVSAPAATVSGFTRKEHPLNVIG
jgi:hypothetical protein